VAQSGTISGVRESPGRLGTVKWQSKMRGVMNLLMATSDAVHSRWKRSCTRSLRPKVRSRLISMALANFQSLQSIRMLARVALDSCRCGKIGAVMESYG
jgi:hypothetical protein